VFVFPGVGDISLDGVIDSHTVMKTDIPAMKKTTTISVVLENETIAHLDHASVQMRLTTGRALNRSMLIRAILTATVGYSSEWLDCLSGAEITAVIGRRLATNEIKEMKQRQRSKPV